MKRRLIKQGEEEDSPSTSQKSGQTRKGSKKETTSTSKNETPHSSSNQHDKNVAKETIELNEHNRKDMYPLLTHTYRGGADKLTFNNVTPADVKSIKQYAERLLLGFEVTDVKDNTLILENISEPTEERYEALFRRIFLIIKETHTLLEESARTERMTRSPKSKSSETNKTNSYSSAKEH